MDFSNISIIGIGLMGSSFALALRKYGFTGGITGIGRREDNLIKAKELGIIDQYSTVPVNGIRDADLILLAAPVGQFEKIVRDIAQNIKKGAIVTDVGSVKAGIVKKLDPLMPEGVSFVGGHPIAGKECSGISAAASDLFKDARCIVTPGSNTNNEALEKIINLWNVVGAKTLLMTPEEHDLIFAAVSHLPHVIAYALVNSIIEEDDKILHYGGKGLRDMTRIALSSEELWKDICVYNKEDILKTLRRFLSVTSRTIKLIEESDWTDLEKEFLRAKEARQLIESD
jgi:prephenate dehydrogenase